MDGEKKEAGEGEEGVGVEEVRGVIIVIRRGILQVIVSRKGLERV